MLLNVGGVIDTSVLCSIPGVHAILLISQAGNITGDVVADVILGKAYPSGKLTTTWAKAYEDYPYSGEFNSNNGDLNDSYYREGLYVGYRYFDTFGIKPAFCFGYGLSYTEFSLKTESVHVEKDEIYAAVRVQNIGSYAGKEVVQLYYSAPEGGLEKPYQELAAYGKTKELLPGEEELLKLSLNVRDMASYSEEKAAWLLEPGEYLLRVGNSSENTQVAARLLLKEEVLTEQLDNQCALDENFESLKKEGKQVCRKELEKAECQNTPEFTLDEKAISSHTATYRKIKKVLADKSEGTTINCGDYRSGTGKGDPTWGKYETEYGSKGRGTLLMGFSQKRKRRISAKNLSLQIYAGFLWDHASIWNPMTMIPRITSTTPVARFNVAGFALLAKTAAIRAQSRVKMTHRKNTGQSGIPPIIKWEAAPVRAVKLIMNTLVPTAVFSS